MQISVFAQHSPPIAINLGDFFTDMQPHLKHQEFRVECRVQGLQHVARNQTTDAASPQLSCHVALELLYVLLFASANR